MKSSKMNLNESPWTSPRALLGSTMVHLIFLAIASLAVLRLTSSNGNGEPEVLRGELGTVDNRAANTDMAGGGPGPLGGDTALEAVRLAADGAADDSKTLRESTADSLLSEALPAPASADQMDRSQPGLVTDTGIGVLPGVGTGGGGGSGGGSGGGKGKGIGPGTEFFGAKVNGLSFVYLIDRSGSMGDHAALRVAKQELIASLDRLPPDAKVGVLFYNVRAESMTENDGKAVLVEATAANKERLRRKLGPITPDDGTRHAVALRAGLALHPEVIFFLTDAKAMNDAETDEIIAEAGSTRIQAIEFGIGRDLEMTNPLRKLAVATGGTYRYIDITKFDDDPRSR